MNKLRFFLILIGSLFLLALGTTQAIAAAGESGPGNGTDYVKVLFAEAQFQIVKLITPLDGANVPALSELTEPMKVWLLQPQGSDSRLQHLKYFLRVMDLRFQAGPCSDVSGKPATICFFLNDHEGPYVLISLDGNRETTQNQAMAMLIHEAGHMTGEPDHLFLDQLGVALVDSLLAPSTLTAQASGTDIVADIFSAKADCESGASSQAVNLRKKALGEIEQQCSDRHLICDLTHVQTSYLGTTNFTPGVGFDMKVTCDVSLTLSVFN